MTTTNAKSTQANNTESENSEQSEFMRRMSKTVESYVLPIYDDTWMQDNDVARQAISDLRALWEYMGRCRQHFDDTLRTEHAKGNLLKIQHIRKPNERNKETKSLESFLTKK